MICAAAVVLLSACAAKPAPREAVVVVPSVRTVLVQDQAINDLFAYQASLRLLSPSELGKAQLDINKQDASAKALLRRAMLLAALHGGGDLGRAQVLLDGIAQSAMPDDQALKPLAQFLSASYGDLRRQEDALDKLNQQLREAQRRNDQLNEKLEALKNIERTLSVRPAAPASAPGAK